MSNNASITDRKYILYMENATSAAALSSESGSGTSWIVGGSHESNLAQDTIIHKEMSRAPEIARDLANRLIQSLKNAILPASESDTIGRVVVIECLDDTISDTKEACFEALGLKQNVDGIALFDEATITKRTFGRKFCYEDDSSDDDEDDKKIKMTTEIMAEELTGHFEFNFSEMIVCAPVLYGGRCKDGNIVAILSMRVWT